MNRDGPLPETIGPYRVTGRLGYGGMGEVLRGHDDRLDRPVALKRVLPDVHKPEKALRRFRHEARAVARLSHPSIVQVYDWEETDGQHWLVMELVEGRSLNEVIAAEGPLPPECALEIARDVASGLAEAHDAGLVHRDLKPTNVIVSAKGRAKILDFGLAKTVRLVDGVSPPSPPRGDVGADGAAVPSTTLTGEGQVVGTVTSMSPEQALGRKVDHRSDLFSLGVLLYEMLSGVLPFKGDSAVETLTRICSVQEEPLRNLDPRIPEAAARLVAHLLEKDPAWRPQDARQVVEEIDRLRSASRETAGAESAVAERETRISLGAIRDTAAPDGAAGDRGSRAKSRTAMRTLLLSDLVDSTRLVERLGDKRAAEIFERHDRLARRLLADHGGLEVDKSDGFLFLFKGPLAAVRYALAYHAELARLATREGVDLRSRVGIQVGEVVLRENPPADVARGAKPLEVEGLAKATAARFMSLAGSGQTLISRGVYDMARRAAVGVEPLPEGVRWVSHGQYRIKGIEEPVEVFEVGVEGVAPLVAPPDSEKVARVTEGGGSRLRGRRWGLAAGGIVIAVGLWGLTSWLVPATKHGPAAGVPPATTLLPEAELSSYDLFRRGMTFLERYDREGNLERAINDFQRALALAENYAPALAGLARAYQSDFRQEGRDPQRLQQALAAAEQAVKADEHLAFAHVSLGMVYSEMGSYGEAVRELELALQIEPLNADAWGWLGAVAKSQGDLARAEDCYLRAIKAQPDDWLWHSYLGSLYYSMGRYEEAANAFERQLELTPDSFLGLRNLGAVYYMQGRLAAAATQFQQALKIRQDSRTYSNLGTILFAQGLYANSVSAFEKAITSGGSNHYQAWANLGDAYRWTPDNEEKARDAYLQALKLLAEELEKAPQDMTLRTRKPFYEAKLGNCGAALADLTTLGDLPTDEATAWFQVAVAREMCGSRDEALAALANALRAGYSLIDVNEDPELMKLRQDARFHRLVTPLKSP